MILTAVKTPFSYQGDQIFALLGMKYCRNDEKPEFICRIAPIEKLNAEKDRLLTKIQSESIERNLNTRIAETCPRPD